MKSTKLLTFCALVTIAVSSCHKTNPYNTDHPDHGKIEFVADWSDLNENDADIPDKYTIYVDGQTSTISTIERVFPTLIQPGKHSILICSATEKITVDPDNFTAKIDVDTSNNIASGNIGRLYTFLLKDMSIVADKVIKVEGKMIPQVRKLEIILNVKDVSSSNITIDDNTAILTGIASKWNYDTNTALSEAKVKPEFKVYNYDEFRASMELLGVVPISKQRLSFKLTYNDRWGQKKDVKVDIDLTKFMQSFNDDKNTPMVLKCNILGMSGNIAEWDVVKEDSQVLGWPD